MHAWQVKPSLESHGLGGDLQSLARWKGVPWRKLTHGEWPKQRDLSRFSSETEPGSLDYIPYCPRKQEMVYAIWHRLELLPYEQWSLLLTSFSLPGHHGLG